MSGLGYFLETQRPLKCFTGVEIDDVNTKNTLSLKNVEMSPSSPPHPPLPFSCLAVTLNFPLVEIDSSGVTEVSVEWFPINFCTFKGLYGKPRRETKTL